MNTCLLILKIAQFVIALVIMILCVAPANLELKDNILNKTSDKKVDLNDRITPFDLACYWQGVAEIGPNSKWRKENLSHAGVFNADVELKDDFSPIYQTQYTVNCIFITRHNATFEKHKDTCTCWDNSSWYLIVAISFSCTLVLTSLCDACSMCGVEGRDQQTTFVQNVTSCVCSLVTGAFMIAVGIILTVFTGHKWPYQYTHEGNMADLRHFYKVPAAYVGAVTLCFGFAITMVIDAVVYLIAYAANEKIAQPQQV